MQIHRNKAAAYIQLHHFTPRLERVEGNDYPAIAFDIPYANCDKVDTITIRPDQDGLYSSNQIRAALGY